MVLPRSYVVVQAFNSDPYTKQNKWEFLRLLILV